MKDRVPVILTKVLDHLTRQNEIVKTERGQGVADELNDLVGRISKLCYEVKTDKPLTPLTDGASDNALWNSVLGSEAHPSWFKSAWLLSECYVYRRLNEAVNISPQLSFIDPFEAQKKEALLSSLSAVEALVLHTQNAIEECKTCSTKTLSCFQKLMRICLWGNKCDLSISAGQKNSCGMLPDVSSLDAYLMVDDVPAVWNHLTSVREEGKVHLHIVLDNAGFELMTDLCLAEFLTATSIVDDVHFHGKPMPWFVSDVTPKDWQWTLDELCRSSHSEINNLANVWKQRLNSSQWVFSVDDFWCSPCDFSVMSAHSPDLYATLQAASLILFKGDLNYRKLIGDLLWPSTTPFSQSLRGFNPAALCALRTLKCDTVVGLAEGQAEQAKSRSGQDWMLDGSHGLIQFNAA